jgi:hypothetical protein
MILARYSVFILVFILSSLVSCSNTQNKNEKVENRKEEAEGQRVTYAVAKEAEAQKYVEIEFDKGSTDLSESAKASLNAIVKQSRALGKINEVSVLSWSDAEYPSANRKSLPKIQRDLAEKRNAVVEDFMRNVNSGEINKYNMAERPTVVSKWFNTEDSKLKKSLLSAGLPTTSDSPLYAGKASRSVVLIKVE